MRRFPPLFAVVVAVLVVFVALATTGCSGGRSGARPPEPFCRATYDLDQQIADATPERQLALVSALADTAPPDLKAKAELWREGMQRVVERKEMISESDRRRYEDAATDLERVAIQKCKILEQNGHGGVM